jgi:hypothetical protein
MVGVDSEIMEEDILGYYYECGDIVINYDVRCCGLECWVGW